MAVIKGIENMLKDEEGQGIVEYALILSLVVLAVVGAVTFLGELVKSSLYEEVSEKLTEIIDSF